MPIFLHKHWKRLLPAALLIVLFPVALVLLLWWDSRLKPDAKVSVSYLKTVPQGGSNAVMFVVSNGSDFPVGYFISFRTNSSPNDDWPPVYPSGMPSTWPLGQTPGMTNSLISVGVFSTNRWKVQILGSDSSPELLGRARLWIAWRLDEIDSDWSRWLQGKMTKARAQVNATGPEMLGASPAP